MKYNCKDIFVDAVIVTVVLSVLALIVGSLPALFRKFLVFLNKLDINYHLLIDIFLVLRAISFGLISGN